MSYNLILMSDLQSNPVISILSHILIVLLTGGFALPPLPAKRSSPRQMCSGP